MLRLLIILLLLNYTLVGQSIAYVSPKRDTLILPNDKLGQTIKSIWASVPKKERPIILLNSQEKINQRNQHLIKSRKIAKK